MLQRIPFIARNSLFQVRTLSPRPAWLSLVTHSISATTRPARQIGVRLRPAVSTLPYDLFPRFPAASRLSISIVGSMVSQRRSSKRAFFLVACSLNRHPSFCKSDTYHTAFVMGKLKALPVR
jgi:hypothetical protein